MRYAAAILSLFVVAAPTSAQITTRPPEQAAGQALMQCVAHTLGQGEVSEKNTQVLAANGLLFSAEPPAFLEGTKQTPYGKGRYATVPSSEGQVWIVGYDGPGQACLLFALGTSVAPIEARLTDMFSIPGAWVQEKAAPADAGERKLQYGWTTGTPATKLTALVSVRDLSSTAAKGMVMVTISQTAGK